MFVIGFGDMTTLTADEVVLLIFMMLFGTKYGRGFLVYIIFFASWHPTLTSVGFIIMRCIIADMTAAEVDIDEVRHKYLEDMKCLMIIMKRENVHSKLIRWGFF